MDTIVKCSFERKGWYTIVEDAKDVIVVYCSHPKMMKRMAGVWYADNLCMEERIENKQDCPVWQEEEAERLRSSLRGITINGRPLAEKLIAKMRRKRR